MGIEAFGAPDEHSAMTVARLMGEVPSSIELADVYPEHHLRDTLSELDKRLNYLHEQASQLSEDIRQTQRARQAAAEALQLSRDKGLE